MDDSGKIFRCTFQDGRMYEGEMKDKLPHGHGILYDKENTLTQDWSNGKYDFRHSIEGEWINGRLTGRVIEKIAGLPHDNFLSPEGKNSPHNLVYSTFNDDSNVKEKTLRVCKSSQSGFFIETTTSVLIFDWYRCELPPINLAKHLCVFISHLHSDHFNSKIFDLAKKIDNINYYIGDDDQYMGLVDRLLDQLSDSVEEKISVFDGVHYLNDGNVSIKSLNSTDAGVAFIVDVDGFKLFHAGDLAIWGGNKERFCRFAEPLRGMDIDYAMLPLDPRFGDNGEQCLKYYLELAKIKCFSPMHLWENYDYISFFSNKYPQYKNRMIAENPNNIDILAGFEGLRSVEIQFE